MILEGNSCPISTAALKALPKVYCCQSHTIGLEVPHILPKNKGGDRIKAPNYWPISITSAVGKNLECIVSAADLKLAINNFLSKHQHRFQPGRSVETNLIILI